jgi:basic membrane protein A
MCCTKDGETIYQPTPGEEQPATTPLVTVIYGPNGLGDRSYCDLIYQGVETAAQKYCLRTLQLSPESEAQGLAYLETMFRQMENATDTVRRLFITPSPVYDAYIRANNKRIASNPHADLLYMETTTPLEGKGSTFYIDYYGAMYMGGCFVHYTAFDLVTLLLANPHTQTVREAGEGFLAGFNDTPKQPYYTTDLHVRYLSNEPSGGFVVTDSTAMRILQEELSSVSGYYSVTMVPICGGAMNTIFRAVRSDIWTQNRYIGIDGNMNDDSTYCPFSIVKHIDTVVSDYIGQWLQGTMPKHQTLGLADGATDVIPGTEYLGMVLNIDSLRQLAIKKEGERYGK